MRWKTAHARRRRSERAMIKFQRALDLYYMMHVYAALDDFGSSVVRRLVGHAATIESLFIDDCQVLPGPLHATGGVVKPQRPYFVGELSGCRCHLPASGSAAIATANGTSTEQSGKAATRRDRSGNS